MLCPTHMEKHTRNHARREIETSTDLKFNPQAKDANHSLIMCVCVCVCVHVRVSAGRQGKIFSVFPPLLPTVFTLRLWAKGKDRKWEM